MRDDNLITRIMQPDADRLSEAAHAAGHYSDFLAHPFHPIDLHLRG
jgi:hypothetical protein